MRVYVYLTRQTKLGLISLDLTSSLNTTNIMARSIRDPYRQATRRNSYNVVPFPMLPFTSNKRRS